MPANDLGIYEREADTWWTTGGTLSSTHGLNPPRFRYFDTIVECWTGVRVLDVGCGGGFTSEFLAECGAVVSGLDVSARSVAVAIEHAASAGLDIDYRHGRAEALPFADASFDVVVCVDVLEHVDDIEIVLAEIHRVLRPGGVVLFDTINRTALSRVLYIWLLEYVFAEIPRGTHDWHMFIRPAELRRTLDRVGFVEPELRGFVNKGRTADGSYRIDINDFMALAYIGHARKPA
jgi:2-polyprenyl-6-hydroxyphenyl methylase/3-demethylubiquinone-9 3-methyltransferase